MATFAGLIEESQPEWFENYHIIFPQTLVLGAITSDQSISFQVFSGFRTTFTTWDTFTNNAGTGTSLDSEPSLPATMNPLDGFTMTLEISINGEPTVNNDAALVFVFSDGSTLNIAIVLSRLVLFPVRPEIPYQEMLRFLTEVNPHNDGSEQRISVRKNPRQFFEWTIAMDDGDFDRSRVDTLMFKWQTLAWGVPMWHEETALTAAATAGDLTITVDSTDNADYRVGSRVLVFEDSQTFDIQTVASFTTTLITLDNGLDNSYAIGVAVTPLRVGKLSQSTSGSRFRSADQDLRIRFRIDDNDSDLGDTSAFDSYNSKVLLDTCNVMTSPTIAETYQQSIIVVDNDTGLVYQDSPWNSNRHSFPLTLRAYTREETFNLRKLMHAFRGRQISFYVPTFSQDLLPTTAPTAASTDLIIQNIGYTDFVVSTQPKDRIWLRKTDGTIFTRQIVSSVETSSTVETLTVDSTWGAAIALGDIDRISYLEEVRYNTDDIVIRHERGGRLVRVSAPVISTFS